MPGACVASSTKQDLGPKAPPVVRGARRRRAGEPAKWTVPVAIGVALALAVGLNLALAPQPARAAGADLWSARSTWGGQVPQAGDTVTIPAGKTVVLDVSP